jgi:hypothetical protein
MAVYELPGKDGSVFVPSFRAVILYARDSRGYWPQSLDETGGVPPQCHSNDLKAGIGNPGGACAACPLAQFGSDAKGKGQACKQTKQLFLMREGVKGFLPEIFAAPPTSLKTYRHYMMALGNEGCPVYGVITEIGLVKVDRPGTTAFSQATFRVAEALSDSDILRVEAYAEYIQKLFGASSAATQASAEPSQGAGDPAFD